jgi:hypothetical protein
MCSVTAEWTPVTKRMELPKQGQTCPEGKRVSTNALNTFSRTCDAAKVELHWIKTFTENKMNAIVNFYDKLQNHFQEPHVKSLPLLSQTCHP